MVLLGVAAVIVWAAIFWQIFSGINDDSLPVLVSAPGFEAKTDSILRVDYVLFASYDDPFLGKADTDVKKPIKSPPKKTVAPENQIIAIDRTKYLYRGSYFNRKLNTMFAIIIAAGNEDFAKEGDLVDGMRVKNILQDSVCLVYRTQSFWIKKQN